MRDCGRGSRRFRFVPSQQNPSSPDSRVPPSAQGHQAEVVLQAGQQEARARPPDARAADGGGHRPRVPHRELPLSRQLRHARRQHVDAVVAPSYPARPWPVDVLGLRHDVSSPVNGGHRGKRRGGGGGGYLGLRQTSLAFQQAVESNF